MSRRQPISYLFLLLAVASDQDSERGGERRELRRDDEFRGGRRAELLEGVQVLEGHRVAAGDHRRLVDLRDGQREPFGAEDRGLASTFGLEDRRLLRAVGDENGRGLLAFGLGDHRASRALGGQLAVHRLLHVTRRRELLDLDVRHLHAPAMGDLVELHPEVLVDLLALGEDIVEKDVADDGAERRRRDALDGRPEILDVQERIPRFENLLVDQEVDRDGRVVLRDAGLLRDLHEELAQVHSLRDKLDRRREQEYETWTANPLELAEREDHQALILGHDMHDRPQDEDRDDQDDDQGD